jgi:DNA repair exonuclease SbcCD nuclease subunit
VKILHTADVHLDALNRSLGDRAADLRARTWEAWERVIDLATDRDVDLLICAGDLFDVAAPPRGTVDRALRGIERLARTGVGVALLPGTHDCWREQGLWDSPRMQALPDNVHLLAGRGPVSVPLPHLDAAIHGCAHRCGASGQRPLCDLRADPSAAINIGVAHASLDRGDVKDDALLSSEEIAATGMDYLALGHWHTWQDVSAGDVTAVLPGSIEVPGFGTWSPGSVALVTLNGGAVDVERVEVGSLHSREVAIDAGDLRSTEDLIARVEEHADTSHLLAGEVTGLAGAETVLDTEEALQRLEDAFFALRITDQSHPAAGDLEDEHLDDRLTLGRFVELARERIEAATDQRERDVAERALQIGVSMLRQSGDGR